MSKPTRVAFATAALISVAFACSINDEAPIRAVGDGCFLASDCVDPLVCAFQRCHSQCSSSKDCPAGQSCVGSNYPKLGICLIGDENVCTRNSDCDAPLVCSSRRSKCEHECVGDRDCLASQVCNGGSCAEPEAISDAGPSDAGATGEHCTYAHECNAPLRCISGICAPECSIDRDCRLGEICEGTVCRASSGSDASPDTTVPDTSSPDTTPVDSTLVDTSPDSSTDSSTDSSADSGVDTFLGFDVADAPDGLGASCTYDSQCPHSLVCRGGKCIPECLTKVDCAAGLDCVDSRCVTASDACVPRTCSGLGLECDTVSDGCGKTLYCGSCESGICGGGGVPGKCGSGVCTPRTCGDVSKNCGFIGDGCGKTIGCGTCTGTQICADNVCVARSTIASCAGGGAGAGPTCGTKFEDCCASAIVPGGSFNRMDDPKFPATVSSFRLDKFEVTVGRIRAFAAAGKGTQAGPPASGAGAHPLISGSGWDPLWNPRLPVDTATLKGQISTYRETPPDPAYDNMVAANVTWFVAFAFCAWDGGRLPTEAEWNYAASGGSEQRVYPWSSPPSSTKVTYDEAICLRSHIAYGTQPVGLTPLGTGRFGQYDLGGNVAEWTLDRFLVTITPTTCIDCAYLGSGTARVTRGAPGNNVCEELVNTFRVGRTEDDFFGGQLSQTGFRCARDP